MVEATKDRRSDRARPRVVQLGVGLTRAAPYQSYLAVQKSFYIESLLALQHVVDGTSQFVSQCRQRLPFAVFVFQPCQVSLPLGVVAEKAHGGLLERPLQVRVADFVARRTVNFVGGFLLRFHQTAVGCEILHGRETGDVVNFVKKNQRENLANAGYRIQQVKRVGVVLLGMAQDFQFDLVEQIVVKVDPLQIKGDIQLHAGIGEALRHTITIASVGDLLPDIRKVLLLIG